MIIELADIRRRRESADCDYIRIGPYKLDAPTCKFLEQYIVYHGKRQVGYIHIRRGHFTVCYPDVDGEELYTSTTIHDGRLRAKLLAAACDAITRAEQKEIGE